MIDILSLTLDELTTQITAMNLPAFRAKQIFAWLHERKAADFSEMSNIPATLRGELAERFRINRPKIAQKLVSKARDTVKYLYEFDDGAKIESVLMRHKRGNSLCISSQVGCRMGCKFCASTVAGFERNLAPSEMLLQLYATIADSGENVDSLVIMGIGEPLDNYDNVLKFLELLQSGHGMSLRHVSLSTCGLADRIDALAKLRLGLTLSVSLHAATDSGRLAIMPVNAKYNLGRLMDSCAGYFAATGRRVSFEYALIRGVNDSESHAKQLAQLLKSKMPGGSCHVNLIPVNEVAETGCKTSRNAAEFAKTLEGLRINATVRRTMGADINAACGQLRSLGTPSPNPCRDSVPEKNKENKSL